MKKKILLIRLDKIGDLICTLCVDQVSFLKDYEVQWAIAQGLSFVPDHAVPQRAYIELQKSDWKNSLKKLRQLLKDFQPDVAVSFQAPWWVGLALWLEKVPVRAGVLSQWHSFLFFNKGLRQKRSRAIQHESAYNTDLLKHALGINSSEEAPALVLDAKNESEVLAQLQLSEKKYVVVHPGMAGSALNWSTANYIRFIEETRRQLPVVLTGTPADEPWLKDIKAHFANASDVINLQNLLKPSQLMAVLKNAKAVLVPSTGVAHIAASLGTPVLGIYSPLRVQHPRRWAARGPEVYIFAPAERESYPDLNTLMDEVHPEQVSKKLAEILGDSHGSFLS